MLAGADQPLPLLGGERQVEPHAVLVVWDLVAGQMLVCQRVRERVEHRAVGAGRLSSTVLTKANIVARSRRKCRATSGM